MMPSTGAPVQKKRAFSRRRRKILKLRTRCCGSVITTSTLLSGSKTGPYGVYQRTERLEPKEGHYMSIETVLLILIVSFAFGFVLDRWHLRLRRSRRRPAVTSPPAV